MSQDESQLGTQYGALMRLAKRKSWGRGDLESTLQEIAEAAANTMDIERVNIWLFDEERTKIRCVEHFQRSTGEHSNGAEISAVDYPVYFRALDEERAIIAADAQGDSRTREFAHGYLDVHGITSMLDAPLRAGGDVIGIICHEHVGPKRFWTATEQQFAASLADFAALALETSERQHAENALRESEKWTREIIAHALDAIVIVDEAGIITDWNPRAEVLFGWSRAEAVGMTLYDSVIPPRFHEDHRRGMRRFFKTGEGAIINKRIEVMARDRAGREFPVELAVSPVRIGDSLAFSAFIRDITDRVQAQLEVHKLNSELEDRVQERTTQLEAAVQERERLLEELQASSVELVDRLSELEQKAEIIRTDLERAQVIQRALLPARPPRLEGVHVDALYRPGMKVGGDLYDVALLDDQWIALYVADAAGHGVAAAMLSVLFKQRLQMCDEEGTVLSPAEVLRRINAHLFQDVLAQGLFLTVAYVLFHRQTGEMRVGSAGHTPILVRRASRENVLLEHTGPALGVAEQAEFTEHRLTLEKGDRVILYSDGLLDSLGAEGADDIVDLLVPALTGDAQDGPGRLRGLFHDVDRRTRKTAGNSGRDDVTLLMLQASGGPSSFDNEPEEDSIVSQQDPPGGSEPDHVLWIAENEKETCLAIRGRGSWLNCETFRRLAVASLDSEKMLAIDLSDCEHLDSAFLGTLHEIVASRPEGHVSVHGPSRAVRGFLTELGLARVLGAIKDQAVRWPGKPLPVRQGPPAREGQQRLLRSHEILSELSEENRRRFAGVIQALRSELGKNN